MIPLLNHTEDTILVSVALVLAVLAIYRGLNKIAHAVRRKELWEHIPTLKDYLTEEEWENLKGENNVLD